MKEFRNIVLSVVSFWCLSIVVLLTIFGIPSNLSEAGEMFGGVNALFSGLALAAIIYTNRLQSHQIQENQNNIKMSMKATNQSLEIMALSTLVQEADATLSRYDRWNEKSKSNNDYANAQKKVRDKLKIHREQLEKKLEQLQNS